MPAPIRVLTAVPICDGHDSAINTINLEFIRHGIEVVYLGYHRPVTDIVRAAIQEDVRAIGISSYNGGHIEFFADVVKQLQREGADDIAVFGGGGGTITHADATQMERRGVEKIFFAGTSLEEMTEYVRKVYGKPRKNRKRSKNPDIELARKLTAIEDGYFGKKKKRPTRLREATARPAFNPEKLSGQAVQRPTSKGKQAKVLGFTGPGGAGKTTLIDELVLRFLISEPKARIAILSHDPSVIGEGALLGDRATMINSQDDRVFMRSMATRGQAGGLSPATEDCLRELIRAGFDYVIIETVGTGQEAMPFQKDGLVDRTVLVMNPDYGARLQLQKIVMLDLADIVVVNKTDQARARAAVLEIGRRLDQNRQTQQLVTSVAKRHRDPGVDELFRLLSGHGDTSKKREEVMSKLGQVVEAVDKYNRFVLDQVKRARTDKEKGRDLLGRWNDIKAKIPVTRAPTGLELPRLALPEIDEPGEIARYLFGEGLPGEFPFLNGAYREMYLEPVREVESLSRNGKGRNGKAAAKPVAQAEEPTRLFSGLMLAEDTNERFHFLTAHQRTHRLSTAFDGPTLYGIDSDADGVFGKIGEGGVAIDTVEDMVRLYDGFDLGSADFSASMTISGPAPIIMAMYIAAAKRRFGPKVVPNLRGTVQADIFKEVQAQNETIFPTEASLRFLTDMVEFTTREMPRWYPISISGYHIGEAGSTPVQQAAYTLSNGFAYAEMFAARGIPVDQFGPRLSFFLDCGLDVEYIALARVSRRIWAIGMRDAFGAGPRGQMFKLHTQTSGRSLVAAEFKNNLTRTAAELMLAYMNATNSSHSNSADEPFTTPSEEWIRLAAHGQAILLEESGIFKHTMNMLSGSPGMKAVERAVEAAILEEFREIESMGGVLAAVENRYQRSQIQNAAHRYEQQIYNGTRPIIALNKYRNGDDDMPEVKLTRTPRSKQQLQVDRLTKFKKKNAEKAVCALDKLATVVERGENCFPALIDAVEVCSLGQITSRLQEIVGRFRPMV